jgi:hypothetical protein
MREEFTAMIDPRDGGLHNPNMEILNEIFNGDELLTHMEQEFRHDQNF